MKEPSRENSPELWRSRSGEDGDGAEDRREDLDAGAKKTVRRKMEKMENTVQGSVRMPPWHPALAGPQAELVQGSVRMFWCG